MSVSPVLLVLDDPILAESLQQVLGAEGLQCHWVRDGAQALDVCKLMKPSVIVTEMVLPVMDGLEFLRVFQNLSRTPVIAISGVPWLLGQALDLGAHAIVQKPFSVEHFQEVLWELRSSQSVPLVAAKLSTRAKPSKWIDPQSFFASEELLQWSANVLGADALVIQLKASETPVLGGELICRAAEGPGGSGLLHRRSPVDGSIWGEALASGSEFWWSSLSTLPVLLASYERQVLKMGATACVPLTNHGQSLSGLLSACWKQPKLITHTDAAILRALAKALTRDALDLESGGLLPSEFIDLFSLLVSKACGEGMALQCERLRGTDQWRLIWGKDAPLESENLRVDCTQFLGAPELFLETVLPFPAFLSLKHWVVKGTSSAA
ncbi:MAG: response regulator [Oligoflexia bacterium]